MKLEPDLVVAILRVAEAATDARPPNTPEVSGFTSLQVQHHVWLMMEQGLVQATRSTADMSPVETAMLLGLRPEGYAFLAAAKNDAWWRKALKGAGSFSLEALKSALLSQL